MFSFLDQLFHLCAQP